MAYRLKCTVCKGKFPWDAAARWPHFCPLCQADINNDRDDDDIVMPFIRSTGKTKHIDGFYREMEQKSEERVHMAAEMAGCSASDMSDLKLTNLNDRRDAEIAHISVNNAVTQRMAEMEARGLPTGFNAVDAAGLMGGTQAGPMPNAGAKFLTTLQGMNGAPGVNMAPPREITQPGYRRRG